MGMREVYRAEDTSLKREVSIEVVRAEQGEKSEGGLN